MIVKINSELSGEMQFDMSAENLVQLIGAATRYAADKEKLDTVHEASMNGTYVKMPEVKPEKPVSKVERMFGDVRSRIPVEAVSTPLKKQDEEYKGFLLIECEDCGKLRGFYAKYPTSDYHCDCGHTTALHDLRPLHLHCKCGGSFKYMTNVRKSSLTYNCLDCGAPVDLEINKSGTAYVTVGYNRF